MTGGGDFDVCFSFFDFLMEVLLGIIDEHDDVARRERRSPVGVDEAIWKEETRHSSKLTPRNGEGQQKPIITRASD